ncbi:MAG TPA: hypothetical protein VMU34_19695 [Mycobacterium sp.]|nr:hypothetical protein [Mycobacterium sp.]
MKPLEGAVRVVANTANAATAAAGAVGGAAVNGVIGGVQGTAQGIRKGLSDGSHSTPAAALTLAALGAAGLVEWPVLLTIGGGMLIIRHLTKNGQRATTNPSDATTNRTEELPAVESSANVAKKAPAKRTAARKAATGRANSARQP